MSTYSGEFHLVLSVKDRGWPDLAARITAKSPTVKPGEIAVKLSVVVPRALFHRPTLRVSVNVPAGDAPAVIDAAVAENLSAALSQQLGVAVHISADTDLTKE